MIHFCLNYGDKVGKYAGDGVGVNSDVSDGISAAMHQSVSSSVGVGVVVVGGVSSSVEVGVVVVGGVVGVVCVVGVAALVVVVYVCSFVSCFGYGTVIVGVLLEVFDVVDVTVFFGIGDKQIVLLVWVGVLSVGCKCPCMGGGDHAIGDDVVGVSMCAHIA